MRNNKLSQAPKKNQWHWTKLLFSFYQPTQSRRLHLVHKHQIYINSKIAFLQFTCFTVYFLLFTTECDLRIFHSFVNKNVVSLCARDIYLSHENMIKTHCYYYFQFFFLFPADNLVLPFSISLEKNLLSLLIMSWVCYIASFNYC